MFLKENFLINFAYPLHHTVCNMSNCHLEREEGMYNRESTRSYIKTAEITVCEYIHNLQSSSLTD
jgi:hypothetical protein